MKKILLTISIIILSLAFASPVSAQQFNEKIKNWNDEKSPVMKQKINSSSAEDVCSKLFNMDQKNIFKEGICAIINVISISTADFAQNVTCTIQNVAAGNFRSSIVATPNAGECKLAGGWSSGSSEQVFGTRSANDGLYGSTMTEVSQNLSSSSGWITRGFAISRSIVVILAIAGLFVISFANILHIDISSYAIKKILPNLIVGIILGFFSITIVLLLSRFIDILYKVNMFSPYNALHPMLNIFGGNLSTGITNTASGAPDFGSISMVFKTGSTVLGNATDPSFITGIIGTIILIVSSVVVFAFEYVMALRPLVIGLLTIAAPFAFICLILPQTQIVMKRWWSIMLIALTYPIIVNFVLFVANSATESASPTGAAFLILVLFKTTLLAFLVRLPFAIESDFRKLTVSLAKTDFGANLGLNKLVNTKEKTKSGSDIVSAAERNLKTREAQGIIASTASRFLRTQNKQDANEIIKTSSSEKLMNTINTKSRNDTSSIVKIADNAFKANANRPVELLVKSAQDLTPDTFRKAITHSNIQLWRDNTAIEELRRKNGQVLDEDGTAIRADSARKLYRLAQVMDQDHIANPEAVKLLAKKGMLDVLPLNILQKALQENLVTKTDLVANFKQNADQVFNKAMSVTNSPTINPSTANNLIQQDHLDYVTGFKDIARQFSDVVKDVKIIPPPPPVVTQNIISNIKNADSNAFDKNGMYFLQRLGDINRQSQTTISQTLQKDGVNPQTAVSISQNPQIDIEDVKGYVPGGNISHDNIAMLREGFINRDLSNTLINNVATMVSEGKVAIGKSISEKLSESLKNDESMNLDTIKTSIQSSVSEISKASPEKLKEIGKQIEKYHPGAMIKTDGNLNQDDIEKLAKHGQDVVETIDTMQQKGVNEEKLKANPSDAAKVVEDQISETIQKTLTGQAPKIDLSIAGPEPKK